MQDQIKDYQRAYNLAVAELKENDDVLAAFVFGSMVSGDLWEKSDIDFFVVLKKWQPGMTNVYSDTAGKPVHYKFLSKKDFMRLPGFDLKGGFLHRLISSSRLVFCRDKGIEQRFVSGRSYPDQPRRIWTLTYFGKLIKATDSVQKSLKNGNDFAAYIGLLEALNWYAMVLINNSGYMVSKDNLSIAAELDSELKQILQWLIGGGVLQERVFSGLEWLLRRSEKESRDLTEVLFRYLSEKETPLSARQIQEDELFHPYHVEAEAILSLLAEKQFLKQGERELRSLSDGVLTRENVYWI